MISTLRPAFSRSQTFNWFVLSLIAFSVRDDLDGVKNPKEGKKMPAVKYLYQGSGSNSKPEFVMGHSFHSFGILCYAKGYYFCVPVCALIHEGLVFSNRDKQTLIDKAGSMLVDIFGKDQQFLLLADAYYANGKMLKLLVALGSILISRVRTNAVAYEKADISTQKKRGRPKLYGTKIKLSELFSSEIFKELTCNLYGEKVKVEYLCKDLVWKPLGKVITHQRS